MKTTQNQLPVIFAILSTFALLGYIYLTFVFPTTLLASWADEARALPVIKQNLINLSDLFRVYTLIFLPLLLMVTFGCSTWALRVRRSPNQELNERLG